MSYKAEAIAVVKKVYLLEGKWNRKKYLMKSEKKCSWRKIKFVEKHWGISKREKE